MDEKVIDDLVTDDKKKFETLEAFENIIMRKETLKTLVDQIVKIVQVNIIIFFLNNLHNIYSK